MTRRNFGIALTLAVLGCASTPEDPDIAPVPVYSEAEVPCEYELVERIRVRQPTNALNAEDFRRRMRVLLGQAGARVGAEAVIAELNPTGMARRREIGPGGPPLTPPFEADAVRFIPGTCGA